MVEEEILEVEDPDEIKDESIHTLECLNNGQIPSGEMIMSCKEQENQQPITVIISSEGLDLENLDSDPPETPMQGSKIENRGLCARY